MSSSSWEHNRQTCILLLLSIHRINLSCCVAGRVKEAERKRIRCVHRSSQILDAHWTTGYAQFLPPRVALPPASPTFRRKGMCFLFSLLKQKGTVTSIIQQADVILFVLKRTILCTIEIEIMSSLALSSREYKHFFFIIF